ncbi:MAG: ATP-binding protein [Myxococcota bacterium]
MTTLEAVRPGLQRQWTTVALAIALGGYLVTTFTSVLTKGGSSTVQSTDPWMLLLLAAALTFQSLGRRSIPMALLVGGIAAEICYTFATSVDGIRTSSSVALAPLLVGTSLLWGPVPAIALAAGLTVLVPALLLLPGGPGIPTRDLTMLMVVLIATWATLALVLVFQALLGQTMNRLARSRRRLTSLIEKVPSPTLVLDEGGRIEALSHSARTLLGLREGNEALEAPSGSIPVVDPQGRVRHFEAFSFEIGDEGGRPQTIRTYRDVSDRVLAERRRAELRAHLEDSLRLEAISRFGGEFVHNLNNTLQVLLGRTDLLPETSEEIKRFKSQHLAELRSAAAVVSRLGTSLGTETLSAPPVRLDELIASAEPELRNLVGDDIGLRLDLRPCELEVDSRVLESILKILVQNAAEASTPGRAIDIRCGNGDGTVEFEVRDHGRGMSRAVLRRAFEPFFSTKAEASQAGLGLPSLRAMVRASNGRVELDSEPGRGTRAVLTWPSHQADPNGQTPTPGRRRILVVDDDDSMRRFVGLLLKRGRFEVLTAGSGPEALRLLETEKQMSLVVTDVCMADMSGFELAERLAMVRPELPVLFMTGYGEDLLTLESGIDLERVLIKPFGRRTLLARVEEILGEAENSDSVTRQASASGLDD